MRDSFSLVLLIICELIEDVMTIEPPRCSRSIHNLIMNNEFVSIANAGREQLDIILCDCTSGIECAEHVDIVDRLEVLVGEFESRLNDSYAGVLKCSSEEFHVCAYNPFYES